MIAELLVLRLVHIVGGIFWVGSGLFTSFFLIPALARSGLPAGQLMAALQQRRLFTVLQIAAVLTILSGLRLMWITSGGFSPGYFSSPVGRTFSWSGGAAIVAFFVGMLISRPAGVRAARLGQQLASASDAEKSRLAAEAERLRRRSAVGSTVAIVLLLLGAGGMAIARYMR